MNGISVAPLTCLKTFSMVPKSEFSSLTTKGSHFIFDCIPLFVFQLTINHLDRRKMPLVFKAFLLEMGENLLVDFRLSKVCILGFHMMNPVKNAS